jgi:superfamily I DNA/RNA helicase
VKTNEESLMDNLSIFSSLQSLSQLPPSSNFNPSSYQKAIFDWIANGDGSCVVSAVPGSGKTTTLVQGCRYLSSHQKVKFLAFNKHIVKELKRKLPITIQPTTLHSLGFASLRLSLGQTIEVKENKYKKLVSQYLKHYEIKDAETYKLLIQLVSLVQLTLTNYHDLQQLKLLCQHYGISIYKNWDFWQNALNWILSQGIEQAWFSISYDGMVWLPHVLDSPVESANFLFIDECQDLNQAQLSLVMRAYHAKTRALFVGDSHQAIMGFAGATSDSIANIIYQTQATQLPLSICYRCPTSHIELANKVYPVIEPSETAIKGVVEQISSSKLVKIVKENDLIISRCFYPLVQVYFSLLRAGIPAQVRKQDIGQQLIHLLELIFKPQQQQYPMTVTAFKQSLDQWFNLKKAEMLAANATPLSIAILDDKIQTLVAIYQGNRCQTVQDCFKWIHVLCQVKKEKSVNLTTIHGSKGLEAQRVFILRPDLMPHPNAKQDWEKEQEKNLFFVALTRAKHSLFFCT